MTRAEYAERVCAVIAHGGHRSTLENNGWGDYLARWIWLRDKGLERDP